MELSGTPHIHAQKTYNKHQIWTSQSEIHKTTHHLHEICFITYFPPSSLQNSKLGTIGV